MFGRAVSCERPGDRDGSEEIAPHCLEAEVVADEGAGTHGPTTRTGPGGDPGPALPPSEMCFGATCDRWTGRA